MTAQTRRRGEFRVESRAQLFDLLQDVMDVSYSHLLEGRRLEYERGLLKSYILETDLFRDEEKLSNEKKVKQFIKQSLTPEAKARTLITIRETDEEKFYEIECTTNKHQSTIYLDASTDDRFWLAYSISNSTSTDWWLDRVVSTNPNIDYAWLWPRFLEGVQQRGLPRGFGLDYDYRRFEEESEVTSYIKMQLWGGADTAVVYETLKGLRELNGKIVLSKVRVKSLRDDDIEPEKENLHFALEDIKYTGKFTVRGTDFGVHNRNLNRVRASYAEIVRSVENMCGLSWDVDQTGGVILDGYAINFIPQNLTLDVLSFCERVFSGSLPFRLLGMINLKHDNYATVNVVDMHTGGKLFFEISPDLITVYLPSATCGNTIARLYTNLQHYLNSNFEVEADNGQRLFRF